MPALWKRKSKGGYIYYVDFYYQGRRYRKSTKTGDKRLAELFLKDIEVKIAKDAFSFNELEKKVLLSEFIEKYLEFSKATKAKNTYLLDKHSLRLLKSFLGNIQLNNITAEHLEEFKVKRLKQVKATSVNIELRHLKCIFNTVCKWNNIQKNPFNDVKQVRIRNSNIPKFLTVDEVKELLEIIPDGNFKNLICFYLNTGCRRNEALNLTWKDIDIENRTVKFNQTKSGLSRVVPINNNLFNILDSMQRNGKKPFPFKSDFVTHKFKKYLRASDIKDKEKLRLHSLRHTFASHLVMNSVDLSTVGKYLGHSSVKVTEIYSHLVPDHLKVNIERLPF